MFNSAWEQGFLKSFLNFDQCGFAKAEEEILPPKELIAKYQAEREAHEAVLDKALAHILALIENKEEQA